EHNATRLEVAVSRFVEPALPAQFRARLSSQGGPREDVFAGQRIAVAAHLRPLEMARNPGEWSPAGRGLREGVLFRGPFRPDALIPLSPSSAPVRWLQIQRSGLAAKAIALAPTPEAGALYATLAAGLRSELGEDWERKFSRSGL